MLSKLVTDLESYKRGWLAGVLDADGALMLQFYKGKYFVPHIAVGGTVRETVKTFNKWSGLNVETIGERDNGENKTMYILQCANRQKIKNLLSNLVLVTKERQRFLLLQAIRILENPAIKGTHIKNVEREAALQWIFEEMERLNA